jgi:CxxC motif-containing protein
MGTEVLVSGNACPKGDAYGRQEAVNPMRSLTTTVATDSAERRRLPVHTLGEIPLSRLRDAMAELDSVVAHAPLRCGQLVAPNLLGLGVDVVASEDLPLEEPGHAD